jgi:23S rRNA (adenine2503-C2)-methyltransferase
LARALLAKAAERNYRTGETASRTLLASALQAFEEALPTAEPIEDPDGTVRFAIRLGDGALVETVLIAQLANEGNEGRSGNARAAENAGAKENPGADENGGFRGRKSDRFTVCVSSQVGCARGCVFCETGRLGFVRNLAAWEIVAQFAIARRYLKSRASAQGAAAAGERASAESSADNVVFMGMGEPLDNLDAVLRAIEVLSDRGGFAVPERRITISTVGIVPRMDELYAKTKANLAVSLHALEEKSRLELLPIARKFDLAQLRAAIARAPRTVLLQWTLIEGGNDRDADADRLIEFCDGLDVRVNLIPLNPGPIALQRAPSLDRGVRAMLRMPHGQSVGGACGQLAGARREG